MALLQHTPWWIWLTISLLPYKFERKQTAKMQALVLSALTWRIEIHLQKQISFCRFSLSIITQVSRIRWLHSLVIPACTYLLQEFLKQTIRSKK